MDARGLQQYKAQSLNTMTQQELLLLLLDELVKRTLRSELALEQEDYPLFEASIDRCIEIVRYLDRTLNRKYDVSRNLHRMYEFFCYDFNRIKLGRNKAELDRIRPMIVDLRDAFRSADHRAVADTGGGANGLP